MTTPPPKADRFIDITDQICPMTFVHTKLEIEKMAPGDILRVRLKGAEPLDNVPRNAGRMGHEIMSLEPEDPNHADASAPHLLFIRKVAKKKKA